MLPMCRVLRRHLLPSHRPCFRYSRRCRPQRASAPHRIDTVHDRHQPIIVSMVWPPGPRCMSSAGHKMRVRIY
jgi:hypothetical protein